MRTNVVAKARIAQGECGKCGKEILAGAAYKWIKGRYSGRRVRCAECPDWRPSEKTGSAALSTVYGAREAAEDAIGEWDGEDADALRSILTEAGDAIDEGAEAYEESAQNIEDGFQHETSASQELRDKADEVRSWAEEVRSKADDIEDFDEEEAKTEAEGELAEPEEGDDPAEREQEIKEAVEQAKIEWADEQREAASDAISECPVCASTAECWR